jgi:hypothetical protein
LDACLNFTTVVPAPALKCVLFPAMVTLNVLPLYQFAGVTFTLCAAAPIAHNNTTEIKTFRSLDSLAGPFNCLFLIINIAGSQNHISDCRIPVFFFKFSSFGAPFGILPQIHRIEEIEYTLIPDA